MIVESRDGKNFGQSLQLGGRWSFFRMTHRNAGIWTLFTAWLCLLFAISYGQAAVTRATGSAFKIMLGLDVPFTSEHAMLFQFHDEVGLLASHASIILALFLLLAVLRPKYRLPLMGASVISAFAIATGMLEKIVYSRWIGANDTMLMAHRLKEIAAIEHVNLGRWMPGPSSLMALDGMLFVDLAFIAAGAVFSVSIWFGARNRSSTLRSS